ncbi:hypothetical protein [Burkholderia ubonensis]|uniref:hypothetical protein n=1 Tax=Burkholderia ubonensis TaxID=101571 RepID=UPI000A58684C|nr:hypothetical protein [Burkholderia ubonensis]
MDNIIDETEGDGSARRHDEVDAFRKSPPSDNPSGEAFNVVVSVPETIQIRMVDASALSDYENLIFVASVLSNAVVGFLVAYFQAVDGKSASSTYVFWTDFVFVVLFVAVVIAAWRKRSSMKRKAKDIKLITKAASSK